MISVFIFFFVILLPPPRSTRTYTLFPFPTLFRSKLFEVCRLRSVPIITFINKVDREGRDPFALLDEIADMLALDVCPMSWPVGMGGQFEGIYDLYTNRLMQPTGDSRIFEGKMSQFSGLNDPQLENEIGRAHV